MSKTEMQLPGAQITQPTTEDTLTEDTLNVTGGLGNREDTKTPESIDKPGAEKLEHTDGVDKTENANKSDGAEKEDNIENTEEELDAQPAVLPTPAKKNAGFGFLK